MKKGELKFNVDSFRKDLKKDEPLYLWIRIKGGGFKIGELREFKTVNTGILTLGYSLDESTWVADGYQARNIEKIERVRPGQIIKILQKLQNEIFSLRMKIGMEFEVRFSGKYGSFNLSTDQDLILLNKQGEFKGPRF